MTAFTSLLAPFDMSALNDDPSTIYGITEDLRIGYMNRGWAEFARANGARWDTATYGEGMGVMDAIPAALRPAYAVLYDRARTEHVVVEHEYECSSPSTFRRFRMLIHPCRSGALLVVHRRIVEKPHENATASARDEDYRDDQQLITQCCHCRCVMRASPPKEWDWVPEYVAQCPPETTHGLCPSCLDYYYPANVVESASLE